MTSSNFGGSVTKLLEGSNPRAADVDINTAVLVKATSVPAGRAYQMKIKGFKNPFSQIGSMTFVVRHYPKCQKLPPNVNDGSKDHSNCIIFGKSKANKSCFGPIYDWETKSSVEMYKDFQITTKIQPIPTQGDAPDDKREKGKNYVGSEDSQFIISFKPTKYFPVYGGQLFFTIPNWYEGFFETADPRNKFESVFSNDVKCEYPNGFTVNTDIDDDECKDNQQFKGINRASEFIYEFSRFDPSLLNTIVSGKTTIDIKCTNFKNPLSAQKLEGFKMEVKDKNYPLNDVVKFPNFFL